MSAARNRTGSRIALPLVAAALSVVLTTLVPARAQDVTGDPNRDLFANFMHNAVIGKFDRAEAFAAKLLESNPDPLAVMRYADEHTNALQTLLLLVNNVDIGVSAKGILGLIHEGEGLVRRDPDRIQRNIQGLGGDPLAEFNAIDRLRDSGEFAVPWLVSTLQDRGQSRLHNRIIRMLPKMGKDAVVPLSIALDMADDETKAFVVRALGEIGYPHSAPYLMAVAERQGTSPELLLAVQDALQRIGYVGARDASHAYLDLAEQYYDNRASLGSDPRHAEAQVWYWNEGRLTNVSVPNEIYDEIMAMRTCERALTAEPQNHRAVAVWLAANIRREAALGMDVESMAPDAAAQRDLTKPADFPRSAYFARAAGAQYCQLVLDMALAQREPSVALGAIAALNLIAGEGSMIGFQDAQQPLASALDFPDQVVRIKAALALANALPQTPFAGDRKVVRTLGDALAQVGGAHALVIDSDESNLNRVMNAIRAEGAAVIGETGLFAALDRARKEMPTVTAIFIATDVVNPDIISALSTIRSNHVYAMTPIVLLTREGLTPTVKALSHGRSTTVVSADAEDIRIAEAWNDVLVASGQTRLEGPAAQDLALQATAALHRVAVSNSTVLDYRQAEGALIAALGSSSEDLQISAANTLARIATAAAQGAIAQLALNTSSSQALREAAFAALAESARLNGNQLGDSEAGALVTTALDEPDLAIRTAAGVALGALDLPSTRASQIITRYTRE